MMLSPFVKEKHDIVSQLCQLQIFLVFLVAVLLKYKEQSAARAEEGGGDQCASGQSWAAGLSVTGLDRVLMGASAVPPALCLVFGSERLSGYLLDDEKRERACASAGRVLGAIASCPRAAASKLGRSMWPPSPPARVGPPALHAGESDEPEAGDGTAARREAWAPVAP